MHSRNELTLAIRIVDSCSITKLKRQNMFERGGVRLAESLAGAGDVALSKDSDKLPEFAARYGDLNRAHSEPLLLRGAEVAGACSCWLHSRLFFDDLCSVSLFY